MEAEAAAEASAAGSRRKRAQGERDAQSRQGRSPPSALKKKKRKKDRLGPWAAAAPELEEALREASLLEEQGDLDEAGSLYDALLLEAERRQAACPGVELPALDGQASVPLAVVGSHAANSLGGLYLEEESFTKAQALFQRALGLWPGNAMAALNDAIILHDHGDARKALGRLEKVMRLCEQRVGGDAEWLEVWVRGPRRGCQKVASAMAATLYHQLGRAEEAVPLLQRFGCRYRLVPELFRRPTGRAKQASVKLSCASSSAVRLVEDTVSTELHAALLRAFRPTSEYWSETDYKDRGYFSFWFRLDREPGNLVELTIRGVAERALDAETRGKLVGAEWWVHSRRAACSAHQLHFDTEENHLSEGEVVHPLVSSVTYLSGAGFGGATAVLDQAAAHDRPAASAVVAAPVDRATLLFPGNALHCVLPPYLDEDKEEVMQQHRLTLMIGFWDRDVHSKGKRRTLGPCSVLPRATRACAWPALFDIPPALRRAESAATEQRTAPAAAAVRLTQIAPAWDELAPPQNDAPASLDMPQDCDKRYFVPSMAVFQDDLRDC